MKTNEEIKPTFSNSENTKIYQDFRSNSWTAETKVKVNGKNWILSTMKRYNGTISTHCHAVQDEGNGNFSFMIFGRDKSEDFYLNTLPKGTKATEKTIRAAHFKALAEFDAKHETGEIVSEAEYIIEIGQIIFTDHPQGSMEASRRAIYEIQRGNYGTTYHTVHLDGSRTEIDSHIRPYTQKFGIGVYYTEGDKISQDEVTNLLIDARENMAMEAAKNEAANILKTKEAEEKAAYLSQFIKADRKTTTNVLKRHIIKTFPQVQKVEIKSDVFSGGSSMDVWYYAQERIVEVEKLINSLQYGRFNGYEDIYEYSDNEAVIIEGHILTTYKYVSVYHKEAETLAVEPVNETAVNGCFEVVDYSERAVAVFGDTKAIKDQLKQLGGRFNMFLNHNGKKTAGWIFPKDKKEQLINILNK